jgi:hypothetical protein
VAINLAAVSAALRLFSCLPRIGNRAPRFFQALEKRWLSGPTRRRVPRVGPMPGREMVLGSRGWSPRPPKRRRKPFRTFQGPESCGVVCEWIILRGWKGVRPAGITTIGAAGRSFRTFQSPECWVWIVFRICW